MSVIDEVQYNGAKVNVLVVDDKPANIFAMKRVLGDMDVNIICANGGYEALALTLRYDFAVALMDVQMPEIDGFETAELMGMAEHSKRIPIIFVTANYTEEENLLRGYKAGGVDYITKPVNGSILESKVKVFVQLHRQKQELHRLNDELSNAWEEAQKANKLKSQFLANISHELRTPMHSIMGFSELCLMNLDKWSQELLKKNLETIYGSGRRLLSLLNDLLDLSKLEAKAINFDFKISHISNVIYGVVDGLEPLLKEKGLSVAVNVSHGVPEAEFDEQKISQVILNYLSNAVKFSPDGAEIRVEVSAKDNLLDDKGREIRAMKLVVSDQGCGVPEDEFKRVFDKFVQSAKAKDVSGGTGLGLAICKEIILAHDGKVWVKNNAKGGADFCFMIPLCHDQEHERETDAV